MDLPTYTNIWRIEKRLYKLYDFRLPMPLPINWIAVFVGITVPYIVFLIAIGLPFNHTLVWLYVLPPGLLTWLTTRPVIENKRLPELVESQVRYLTEPRVWTRLAPHNEKDQMVVTARVWHTRQAPQRRKTAKARAAAGTVALRGRNALARRGVAATAIGDPAEGNAPLAAASALAAAPATAANSRSRARARGTGPRIPAPGPSGRQRPPGKRTRPPRQDWAAQQREAARHDELPEETRSWPAEQPPRAQTTGTEDQAAKPSRFRLSALRSRPAGQAPALPPGVALRRSRNPVGRGLAAHRLRIRQEALRPWPEGPDRPGQAGPAWRMPAIRSAPPLGSVAAPMSSDLPAHATPDVYPASLPAPDVEPATSAHAAVPVHPALDIDLGGPVHVAPYAYLAAPVLSPSQAPSTSASRDEDQAPPVHAAQDVGLDALLGPVSPEVAQDTPSSATTLDGEAATSAPAAPEAGPPAQAPDPADVEPATSAPASSEAHAASATPEVDPDAPPVALDGEPATWVHVGPGGRPGCPGSLPHQTLSLRSRHPLRPRRTGHRPLPRSTRARRLSLLSASRPRGCTSSRRSTRLPRLLPSRTSTRPRLRAAPSRRARRHRRLPRPTSARRRHPVWATCGQTRRRLRRAAHRALRYRMTGRSSGLCRPRRSRRSTPPWHGRRPAGARRFVPVFCCPDDRNRGQIADSR